MATQVLKTTSLIDNVFEELDKKGFLNKLEYLYSRWLDESEYEDFNDYIAEAKKALPDTYSFVKMSKRPFSVTFTFVDKTLQLSITKRSMKLIRIK